MGSRLEVIMQTNSIKGKSIGVVEACKEIAHDMSTFGLAGVFRGQGIGIAKAIVSLTLYHEGRIWIGNKFKAYNKEQGLIPPKKQIDRVPSRHTRVCKHAGWRDKPA